MSDPKRRAPRFVVRTRVLSFRRSFSALALVSAFASVSGCRRDSSSAPVPPDDGAPAASAPVASAPVAPESASAIVTPPPAPHCVTDGWTTYAHDVGRTSASPGCAAGRYRVAWTWTAEGTREREARAHHVIADTHAVYVVGVKGNSPVAYKLSTHGKLLWQHDTRADIQRSQWPTLALGSLVVNDDGFYLLSPETGKNRHDRGLDTWGQSLAHAGHWFLTNTWHVEGPGVFVGKFDHEGRVLWKANKFGSVKEDVMDDIGAIAFDHGTLFQAANYKFGQMSGVFAFDAATGAARWSRAVMPIGDLSTAGGRLFSLEKEARGKEARLVARSTDKGETLWQAAVPGVRVGAPVLAAHRVIVDRGEAGVFAMDQATGVEVWHAAAGKRNEKIPLATTLCAATGTDTLVVTSADGIAVLSLVDGETRWSEPIEGLTDVHSPVLVGKRLYVMAGPNVVALDPVDAS